MKYFNREEFSGKYSKTELDDRIFPVLTKWIIKKNKDSKNSSKAIKEGKDVTSCHIW